MVVAIHYTEARAAKKTHMLVNTHIPALFKDNRQHQASTVKPTYLRLLQTSSGASASAFRYDTYQQMQRS